MASKKYDLAVKVGSYQDRDGETKGRYENIGSIIVGKDGSEFMLIKRTFNPAGVPNPENRDSVIVSCFSPKNREKEDGGRGGSGKPQEGLDDEIAF